MCTVVCCVLLCVSLNYILWGQLQAANGHRQEISVHSSKAAHNEVIISGWGGGVLHGGNRNGCKKQDIVNYMHLKT